WRGIVFAGELVPTLDFHQAKVAVEAWHEVAAPEVKRWWRGKKRAAQAKVKAPVRKATAGVKAKAIGAAWDLQTGGAGLPQRGRGRRCTVKGCRRGWLTIRTRVHSGTGKKASVRVRCAICTRADD
ncbi:hypothetical protein ACWDPF_33660, partial [Streptomyces albogriseolus]